jgi:hypothetical protein
MKREALIKLNRSANEERVLEQPASSATVLRTVSPDKAKIGERRHTKTG